MKKYREYMKEGITLSRVCLKNNGIFKYYVYCFLSVIFYLSIFLIPYAGVAKYEIKNQIKKNKGITLSTLFRGLDHSNYSKLLVANIIKFGLFFGAFLIIGALAALSYTLGLGISMTAKQNSVMASYFTIPFGLVLIIFLLAIPFVQGPNAYIANKYPNMKASGIVYNSFNTYKKGGKLINFLFMLSNYLPRILYFGIAYLIAYGFGYLYARGNGANAGNGLMVIIMFIFGILYLIFAPLISLIHIIAKSELLDDIVIDNYNNDLKDVYSTDNIKRIKILKHNKQKSFKLLFDDADKFMDNPSYINTLNELEKDKKEEIIEKVSEPTDELAEEVKQETTEQVEKKIIEAQEEKEEIVPDSQPEITEDVVEEVVTEESPAEVQEEIVEQVEEQPEEVVGIVEETTEPAEEVVEEEPSSDEVEEAEEVIYVDEDGNEISPDEIEEVVEEVEETEESTGDEIDELLNSIPTKKED